MPPLGKTDPTKIFAVVVSVVGWYNLLLHS
jgi:hypothetical protein